MSVSVSVYILVDGIYEKHAHKQGISACAPIKENSATSSLSEISLGTESTWT